VDKVKPDKRKKRRSWGSMSGSVEFSAGQLAGHASSLDAPHRVTDLATGLPSITTLFSEFRPLIESEAGAAVVYVHLSSNHLIEERFGWEAQGAYIELITSYLDRVSRDLRRDRQHCVVARAFADDYVIMFPHTDDDQIVSSRIAEGMNRHVQAVDDDLASLHEVYMGTAHVTPFPRIHPERLVYRAIVRAQTEAMDVGRHRLAIQTRVLDRCLSDPDTLRIVFQPLISVGDERVFAFEALVRCTDPVLRSPHMLFNVAEQSDRVWPLSRILRAKAIARVPSLPRQTLLFINLHPCDFDDPELVNLDAIALEHADRIVFEVTERAAIRDVASFRRSVDFLRQKGFRVAIDDLGAGYASLSSVADLRPDFMKLDMTLIRGIDQSMIRRNLVRNMISFAQDFNARVVAEGVETTGEYKALVDMGCHYAQGFLFAEPDPEFVTEITISD
jgi:EAL domain-containing protein (putative c-di-GMP-specific phosphodiesterase class I)